MSWWHPLHDAEARCFDRSSRAVSLPVNCGAAGTLFGGGGKASQSTLVRMKTPRLIGWVVLSVARKLVNAPWERIPADLAGGSATRCKVSPVSFGVRP